MLRLSELLIQYYNLFPHKTSQQDFGYRESLPVQTNNKGERVTPVFPIPFGFVSFVTSQ